MSDQHRGLNRALDRARIEPGGINALENAAREIARTVGAAPEPGPPTAPRSVDKSSRSNPAEPDATDAETVAPRGVQSSEHASRTERLLGAVHAHPIRTLLIAGALFAIVIIVAVSPFAAHKSGNHDVVTQRCVVHEPGAEATVVVTNHGTATASYTFDVVFSQNQSALEGVPVHVTALPAGKSATFRADSGSLDTSRPFTCTVANLHRLPG